jgi:uncharacterized OB-fold protein
VVNRIPYIVAVVELDEGPSFLTNIVGCEPARVACDLRVTLQWEDAPEGLYMPVFSIIEEGKA